MAPKETQSCLGCGKKFNKSDYSLQCTVCALWIHKTCSGISDEGFKFVNEQLQSTGMAYWACRPCTSYAMNMNHRLKQVEERVEKISKTVESNSAAIREVDKKVDQVREDLNKKEDRVEEAVRDQQREMYDELRQRELRKKNVIFHGIQELQKENSTYKERTDWDRASIGNILRELKVGIKEEAVKFCKRIGEIGTAPRPLLTGFHMENDKLNLLRVARNLEDTCFSDVNIAPDLTKKQRDEEAELKKEAERRNKNLSESDVSKNLHWAVVGPRGERRLTKEKKDTEWNPSARRMTRGGHRDGRGGQTRGGTTGRRILTGANSVARGPAKPTMAESRREKDSEAEMMEDTAETESEEDEGTETETEPEPATVPEPAKAAGTKRTKRKQRSAGAEAEGPPVKK
jgi:hypothetical protein